MSHVDGELSENPYVHLKAGMKDFIRFDKVRLVNIFGSIQYGLLYAFTFFFAGIGIEALFPLYNPNVPVKTIIWEVLIQCIVIILVTFYARKFIEAIPGIMTFFPNLFDFDKLVSKGFIPYGIDEFKGEVMMSVILIGVEVNLFKKVEYLSALGRKWLVGS